MARLLLAAVLCFGAASAHAGLYKVVGPDGTVTYTDRAPDAGAKVTEIKVQAYSGPVKIEALRKPAAPASPFPTQKLTMFSASWCGACKQAKAYLNAQRIPYDEVDVDSPSGAARFAELGGSGVPMFQVGRTTMTGFSPQGIAGLLERAGKP